MNCLQEYDFKKLASQQKSVQRLIAADIHAFIVEQFGKHYHPDSIYYLPDNMGFSWVTSRSRHPKQSQQIQDDFKKTENRNDP
ncbi:winged helix-turn-helix domain-containing protein [Alteromonas macleodii]|uniref:helix-turn-helix domain-containing protein n=1 Tax=Alteromonas macleodii TaxID=28108 RepID=UPI0009C012F6